MPKVLVTGANGFVGRELCKVLQVSGWPVRAAVRHFPKTEFSERRCFPYAKETVAVGDIGSGTDWTTALRGVDAVVHLAARVHILQEMSKNPLESFRSVNVQGSVRLAKQAAEAGIKRFVYVSSISIHGNSTDASPYVENDESHPHSPYAVSKWEGELALRRVAEETGMELVIVRPPLVYGPGVGGNFLRLMRWADKGWPLPLGRVKNLRSFIGIDNLVDMLVSCVEHPNASGETFLVADGEDLSTPDLIQRVARLLGRTTTRIIPFPIGVLRAVAAVAQMDDVVDRLCNSLQVSAEKAKRVLGWCPRVSLDEGLKRTINWYMNDHRKKRVL